MYYTDEFTEKYIEVESIRMDTTNEIIAMKLDVILRGGRKKDFWDLHYFIGKINMEEMIELYKKRYPYNDDFNQLRKQLTNFEIAEDDIEPICLMDKSWEIIKIDFYDFVK